MSDNIFASNINAVCHVGGLYSIKEGKSWKLEFSLFAQHKFYYIKSGSCKIVINGKEFEGIPGRWFLIPAGVPHSYANDNTKPFSKLWMHFDVYPDSVNFFKGMNLPYFVDVPQKTRADKLFKEYFEKSEDNNMTSVFRAKAMLLEIIAEYVSLSAPELKIQLALDPMVRTVSEYIENNMEQSISVDELAHICHLHPTYFIRLFKKKTGETPAKYIQIRKMENAKRLIEETELPISEIMSRVGIIDAAQFAKKFRVFYGNSPRAFRKNIDSMNATFKSSGIKK